LRDRITGIPQRLEVDSLDHSPTGYIKTGNNPPR
jgi:hypothetical protein